MADVTGTSNTAVNWEVNGTVGGSQKLGFISASGLYVAPAGTPTKSDGQGDTVTTTVTVKAVSQVQSTASGSSTVTVVPDNAGAHTSNITLGTSGSNAHDFQNTANNTVTCCGGTLGSLVTRAGVKYILSNNHILARSDGATLGDAIVQPGLIDTATCSASDATTVANLSQFFNLETSPPPNIDAALAQIVPGKVDITGAIFYLGAAVDANNVPVSAPPQGGSGMAGSVNLAVAKSGRSTGLTCSTIDAINTATSVEYTVNCDGTGNSFTVLYDNQVDVLGGDFSGQGDSGSLIVSQSSATPVALLYAGSDSDTVGNPVGDVLNFFKSGGNNLTFVGGSAHAVIGCTLPNTPNSAKTVQPSSLTAEVMQKATATRDLHAPELMKYPEVQSVGVGASYDNPNEPAIVFFVTQGEPHTDLPAQVDGIRTRIVEGKLFSKRGVVSAEESATAEKSAAAPQLVYPVSDAEIARARVVHTGHVATLRKQPGVQGVGIGSSVDSPGEAALMIFTIRGVPHDPIPAVIEGLRTRVRESSRFRAGTTGSQVRRACQVAPANAGTKTNTAIPVPEKH